MSKDLTKGALVFGPINFKKINKKIITCESVSDINCFKLHYIQLLVCFFEQNCVHCFAKILQPWSCPISDSPLQDVVARQAVMFPRDFVFYQTASIDALNSLTQ